MDERDDEKITGPVLLGLWIFLGVIVIQFLVVIAFWLSGTTE